jgi:hypothetical protein
MKNINVKIVGQSFSGHYFPKDLAAMIHFAIENESPQSGVFLSDVDRYNHYVRSNRVWMSIKGSAASDD